MSETKGLEVGFAEGVEEEIESITEPIEKMIGELNVGAVFGEPAKEEEVTVIPVAKVSVGFGYGYGFGKGPGAMGGEEEDEEEIEGEDFEGAEGGGGGGGGGGGATPVGYIKITPDGVEYEGIVDETKVAIAGIAMGAWAVFWCGKVLSTLIKAVAKKKS
jgi:uncharacterized spore protein YtfJ